VWNRGQETPLPKPSPGMLELFPFLLSLRIYSSLLRNFLNFPPAHFPPITRSLSAQSCLSLLYCTFPLFLLQHTNLPPEKLPLSSSNREGYANLEYREALSHRLYYFWIFRTLFLQSAVSERGYARKDRIVGRFTNFKESSPTQLNSFSLSSHPLLAKLLLLARFSPIHGSCECS